MRLTFISLTLVLTVAIAACGATTSPSTDLSEPPIDAAPASPQISTSPTSEASPDVASADAEASPFAAAPTFETLSTGSFVSGEHPTQGTVRLINENGQHYVELADNFQTNPGPDLFVILHRSDDVIGSTVPPAYPIREGDYVTIAPLQQVSGTQRYDLPASLNVDDYASVAIWCRQFNAIFGSASL